MKKIFLDITVLSIALLFAACSDVDFTAHEYTPDGIGNNDWTNNPDSIDKYGIPASDASIAGKPASFLADSYKGALTLMTEGNEAEPVEQNIKVRATSIEGTAINLVFDNVTIMKNDVPTLLGTIVLKDIDLITSGAERVKFDTLQTVDTPSGLIAFNVKGNGKKDDLNMTLILQETSGDPIEYTYTSPYLFEKDPKDPRFIGTPVSQFDMNNTGTVTVEIDGVQLPPSTEKVTIMATDGTHFNFSLKNFILMNGEDPMPVGTVKLKGVEIENIDGSLSLTYNKETRIIAGDPKIIFEGEEVEVDEDAWLGPMLPPIPIQLNGTLKDGIMDIIIDIDMQESIGQMIHVNFNTKQAE